MKVLMVVRVGKAIVHLARNGLSGTVVRHCPTIAICVITP
jgi:hypothetical protein